MRWISIAIAAAALAACDGTPGSDCHAQADCDDGLGCAGPNDPQACGIPPRQGCADDSQCTGGDRCQVIFDACSPDGFGSECRSPCTGEGSCGAGLRCDAGACVAIRCDEVGGGVSCAGREVCDPARIIGVTPVYDRTDGCYPVDCTSDAMCGERVCVNGTCQDALGVCRVPELVP